MISFTRTEKIGLAVLSLLFGLAVFGLVGAIGRENVECWVTPFGGTPVAVHEFHGSPFVCGEFENGFHCMKMRPCQTE